jgi:hypothetical protein
MSDQNQPPSDQSDPWAQFPAVTWNDFPETQKTPAQQHAARVEGFRPAAEADLQRQERNRFGIPQLPDVEIPLITPLGRRLSAGVQAGVGEIGERLNLTERQDFGDRYANALAREEAARNAYRAAHPNLARAGDVGGVVAGVAGIPQTGAANLVMRGASRLPAFLEPITRRVAPVAGAAIEGGIQGGAEGMAEALPGESLADIGQRGLAGATQGAIAGGGLQAALPTVARMGSGVVRFARNVLNPFGRAEHTIISGTRAPVSGTLTPQEYDDLIAQGLNPSLADVQGGRTIVRRALGRLGPDSQEAADFRNMIQNRWRQLNENTQRRIDSTMTGNSNDTIDAFSILNTSRETARVQNKPAYDLAYSNPNSQNILSPQLEGLFNLTYGQNAIKSAIEGLSTRFALDNRGRFDSPFSLRNPNEGFSESNPYILDPNKPVNLEFWDRFRQSLDTQYRQLRAANDDVAAGDVYALRDSLQKTLTTLVPDYATAVSGAGRYKRGDNAFTAGTGFIDDLGTNPQNRDITSLGEQIDAFKNRFSNEEREQFALGVASRFRARPDEAAALIGSGDTLVLRNLRDVLGSQFEPIRNTMLLHNVVRQVENLVPINPTIPTRTGGVMGVAANLAGQLGYGAMSGTVPFKIIIPTVLAHVGLEVRNHRLRNEAYQILRMASDPSQIGSLTNLINTNARYRQALEALQPALNNAVARQAAASNAEAPDERPTRASGGRITSQHRAKAQALINAADRAKKAHNGNTKPILDMPDETVAKALSLADQAI